MIDAKTREEWRAKALRAASLIAERRETYACLALAPGDPRASLRGLFEDAFRPSFEEREQYAMDGYAWLGGGKIPLSRYRRTKDRKVRVLALLFFYEMLGNPGSLSGPNFHTQA